MRRPGLLTLLVACLPLFATACGGNCRALNEFLCTCTYQTQIEVQACYQDVRVREGDLEPTSEEEEVCGSLLESCQASGCAQLETPEGKAACGLSR